jgi:hypothetical protein
MGRRCSEGVMELMKVDIVAVYQYIKENTDKNIDCSSPIARELQACIVAHDLVWPKRIRFWSVELRIII